SVYGRKFQTLKVEPLVVAFGQVTASAVIMLVILLIMGTKFPVATWSMQTMASVLALALVSTALAYVIFFRILARGGATNISLVTLLIPVSAIVLGVTFLDEKLAISHVVGMLIVFIGLIVLDGRLWRIWKSRRLTKDSVNNDNKYKMTHWRTKCKL
ncbi:Permease of the drug/metabolite transporter (DMT) superfamily, partial [hydrothermal vent metagenome]